MAGFCKKCGNYYPSVLVDGLCSTCDGKGGFVSLIVFVLLLMGAIKAYDTCCQSKSPTTTTTSLIWISQT